MSNLSAASQQARHLSDIAAQAVVSVPVDLSARRRPLRLVSLTLVSLCVAAPFLGAASASILSVIIALAVTLRIAALMHMLRGATAPAHPEPEHLPLVSVLLPLRGEARVVADLAVALGQLDYPTDRVEVFALLEEDDFATRKAIRTCAPRSWHVVLVPRGRPTNKPRACNVGVALARGEVVVVFDAEDRPEPDQARKAVAALAADRRVAVAQARLGCDHAGEGKPRLGRFWGLEYAVLFGAVQPALARLGLPFLLGGTSNWFRAEALREVGGWDAHNVTEDADLAVRLARAGWRSTVVDSTTWEEAPISLRQWVGQRSRWLKGFVVTTVVHFGHPVRLVRDLGTINALAIVAQLPGTLVCAITHPLGLWWIATGRLDHRLAALTIGGYLVAIVLHAVMARRQGGPVWLALVMPFYWLLQAPALCLAMLDLARDPTHWRKTEHGVAERPLSGRPLAAQPARRPAAGRRAAAERSAYAPPLGSSRRRSHRTETAVRPASLQFDGKTPLAAGLNDTTGSESEP